MATLDPDIPLYAVHTVDYLKEQSRWGHRVFGAMFATFGIIALILCAVGLYGVVAYSVSQRRHEIGVRMAFGASARQVFWLVGRSLWWQVAVGGILGAIGALGIGKLLKGLLVQTSSADPMVFTATWVLLAAVGAAACYIPSRAATRVDPATVLRND